MAPGPRRGAALPRAAESDRPQAGGAGTSAGLLGLAGALDLFAGLTVLCAGAFTLSELTTDLRGNAGQRMIVELPGTPLSTEGSIPS